MVVEKNRPGTLVSEGPGRFATTSADVSCIASPCQRPDGSVRVQVPTWPPISLSDVMSFKSAWFSSWRTRSRVRPRFSPTSRRVIGEIRIEPEPHADDRRLALVELVEAVEDPLEVVGLDQQGVGGLAALVGQDVVEGESVLLGVLASGGSGC